MWLKNNTKEMFELGDTLEVVPEKWHRARMPEGTRVKVIAEDLRLENETEPMVRIKWLNGPLEGGTQLIVAYDYAFRAVAGKGVSE